MTDPIAAHLAAVRRDRYSDATRTARRRKTFTGASKAEVRNRVSENAWAGGQAVRFSIARTVEAYHSRPPCAVGTFCRLSASAICR